MLSRRSTLISRRCLSGIVPILGDAAKLKHRLPLAKIVATIGPVSEHIVPLKQVFESGMRIMRINFSHATYEEALLRVTNLNTLRGVNMGHGHDALGVTTNMRAVMLDTQGPEIRTGSFDVKKVDLKIGQEITLTTNEEYRFKQTSSLLWISYTKLADTVKEGSTLLIDDGLLALKVKSRTGPTEILCTVCNSTSLGNKKGVFLPGMTVDLPALSAKDTADIAWGIKHHIDYIAASFVRKPADVHEIRTFCQGLLEKGQPMPRIISKIESTEALVNFDEILAVSDGIMIARGDLAVEIPIEGLANVQKEIVHRCNIAGKPVIVATQMLDSMQTNPRPTRAESLDVANAIIDGADCVMLSGESANGLYPVASVEMMKKIIHQAELGLNCAPKPRELTTSPIKNLCTLRSMAFAAVSLTHSSPLVAGIVVHLATKNLQEIDETLVQTLSSMRPNVPIFVFVPTYKAGRLLQIYRGVHPLLTPPGVTLTPALIRRLLTRVGVIGAAEEVVVLHGNSYADMSLQIAGNDGAHPAVEKAVPIESADLV